MRLFGAKYVEIDPHLHKCFPYVQHQYASSNLRKITWIVEMILILNLLFTFVHFTFDWDITYFVKVANTQTSVLFAVVIAYKGLSCVDLFAKTRKLKMRMWSFDEVGPKVSKELRTRRELLQRTRIFLTVFSSFVICFCFPITGDNREIFIFFDNILVVLGSRNFVHVVISSTIVFMKLYFMYAVISLNYICLLATDDVVSYIILLRRKLQTIREIYGEEDDHYYDESYQKYTNETLKKCISQHALILKYAKMVKSEIEASIVVLTVLGILCLAFLYIKAKMDHGIRFIVNSLLLYIIYVTCTVLYCNTGQLLMDECENLYHELYQCPWRLWNESNKFNYKMFLLLSRDPLIITRMGLTLNNRLIVFVLQRVLSVMAFIEQTSTKH